MESGLVEINTNQDGTDLKACKTENFKAGPLLLDGVGFFFFFLQYLESKGFVVVGLK